MSTDAALTRFDRVIAAVSPERALRRARARRELQSLGLREAFRDAEMSARLEAAGRFYGEGSYAAASSTDRATKTYNPRARSADEDAVGSQKSLRARARAQERDNPLAAALIGTQNLTVVGFGLSPQASIDYDYLGLTEDQADEWESHAQRIWAVASAQLDWGGQLHFLEQQAVAFGGQLVSGDVLVVRRYAKRAGDLLGTKVQLIEADRVSTPDDRQHERELVDGVEVDQATGQHIRFHVCNQHPDSIGDTEPKRWVPVPARNRAREVLAYLLKSTGRPDQTRGVSVLAPVIVPLLQTGRMTNAELQASVITSLFTLAVETESGAGLANRQEGDEEDEAPEYKMGPGATLVGRPGDKFVPINPNRPNANYDPFMLTMTKYICAATGFPPELVLKQFIASYSAARAAMNEAWRAVMTRRDHFARNFCAVAYEWVLGEAIAAGLIHAPGFFDDPLARAAWLGASWTGPPRGQIDEAKETEAARDKIQLGASTHEQFAASMGTDFWQNLKQLKRELAARKTAGLDVEVVAEKIVTEGGIGGGQSGGGDPDPDPDQKEGEDKS